MPHSLLFSSRVIFEVCIRYHQDEARLEEEERAREEKRRGEDEERQRAAQREQERREKEELERAMREEAERLQRERRDKVAARSTSGVRGVRGTRASMRAGAAARGGASRAGAPIFTECIFGPTERSRKTAPPPAIVVSVSSSVIGGHTRAASGTMAAPIPSKIARPSSTVSSTRGTTSIPRGISRRP